MLRAQGEIGNAMIFLPVNTREEVISGLSRNGELSSSQSSKRSDSGDTNSPQTLWRGKRSFSSSNTLLPARAAVMAQAEPAGPAPTPNRSDAAVQPILPI